MTRTAASYVGAMVLLFAVVELSPVDTPLPVDALALVLLVGTLPFGLLVLAPYVLVLVLTGNALAPGESATWITYAATAVALVGNGALLDQFVRRLAAERGRRRI